MVKWTNAGGQTKGANEQSFVYRPPVWRQWRNVKTTYSLEDCVKVSLLDKTKETAQRVCLKLLWKNGNGHVYVTLGGCRPHLFPIFLLSHWHMKNETAEVSMTSRPPHLFTKNQDSQAQDALFQPENSFKLPTFHTCITLNFRTKKIAKNFRCRSTPVSTVLWKLVGFFIINIFFLENGLDKFFPISRH